MKYKILGYVFIVLVILASVTLVYYWQIQKDYSASVPPVGHKDITTTWNTYTNTEYGFELKYPKDWIQDGDFLYSKDAPKGVYGVTDKIYITVQPNPSGLSLKDWLEKNRKDLVISEKGPITIVGGGAALQYIEGGMVNYLVSYILINYDVLSLTIPENSAYLETYNQIVATLKMIKNSASESTCNAINNSMFASVNKYTVGMGPNGAVKDNYQVIFKDGKFQWKDAEIGGGDGSYICDGENIKGTLISGKIINGQFNNKSNSLIWNNVEYKKIK